MQVLRGLDLEVYQGEFLSVVGASGSGKSTHAAPARHARSARRRRPFSSMAGASTTCRPRQRDQLRNRTFGFIFQFYHLLPELNTLENVLMPQMIAHSVFGWLGSGGAADAEPRSCSTASAWAIASSTSRANCPAARCSAPPLPGP